MQMTIDNGILKIESIKEDLKDTKEKKKYQLTILEMPKVNIDKYILEILKKDINKQFILESLAIFLMDDIFGVFSWRNKDYKKALQECEDHLVKYFQSIRHLYCITGDKEYDYILYSRKYLMI